MEPVTLIRPKQFRTNLLVSMPHSGTWIPNNTKEQFTHSHLTTLRNTDWYLDLLYSFLPEMGVTVIKSNFSRYIIDPNRELNEPLFGAYQKSAVYKTNTWGEEIYKSYPDSSDIKKRIETYYQPYHQALINEIEGIKETNKKVILLDLHSFMGPIENEICIGDNHGKSCNMCISDKIAKYFSMEEYDVVKNKVFSGGYITKHYGTMSEVEAMQVELRYTTYLSKEQLDKPVIPSYECPEFYQAQAKLKNIFSQITRNRLNQQRF